MSKFICATSTTRNINSSSHHQNRPKYISPLQKLDERTKNWQPGRVQEENRLKQLYEQGKCNIFQPLSSYRYYHIHKNTPIDLLDDLIDYAKAVKHYTIDTEDQLVPKRPSIPALIQIEYVYDNNPSILLIIECMYLPEQNEPTFTKIKQLCKIIFSMGHTIYSWGNLANELEDFYQYNLFDKNDINHVNGRNVQGEFKKYFNTTYPTSPDIKLKSNETYSLQFAIFNTFNEWLTKRYTLGNFGCGLDPALHTITVPKQFKYMQEQVIEDEKEIKELLINYALNDCLGVTKLVNKLPSPTKSSTSTTTCNDIVTLKYYEEEYYVEINAPNDELTLNDNDIPDEQKQNSLTGVHVRDEPYEMISDNEIDDISLPEITKLHLPLKQHHLDEPQERVHGQGKSLNEIEIISDDDIEQYTTTTRPFRSQQHRQHQQHQSLTRNQRKNRKKRRRRYRFEVIRRIYHKFNISNIKKILIFMNIPHENLNVVGHTLFLDMKNKQMEKEVDEKLHDGLFTKEHYYRIRKKLHLDKNQ
ncbi:unnamed protein product [Rotaria sordida]|uniref:Uncharacterized protein n=2 Tax=Rotaria sordida TaxID=392033 RepID=A0A815QJZ7_9BILA|nr:unnamed protein product [Rotaria sordida]